MYSNTWGDSLTHRSLLPFPIIGTKPDSLSWSKLMLNASEIRRPVSKRRNNRAIFLDAKNGSLVMRKVCANWFISSRENGRTTRLSS